MARKAVPSRPKPEKKRHGAAGPGEAVGRSPRRSYGQYCGLAKALDVVGERWTLLLARDLMLGPKRFGELQRGLDGLAPNLLAARLKEMEAQGLIARTDDRPPAYVLTRAGRELEPVLLALGQWGFRYLARPDPADRKELAWALFALKRRYRGLPGTVAGAAAAPTTLLAEIRCRGRVFQYRLGAEGAELRETAEGLPDVVVQGSDEAFRAWFFRSASAQALRASGQLDWSGGPGSGPDAGGAPASPASASPALSAFAAAFGLGL